MLPSRKRQPQNLQMFSQLITNLTRNNMEYIVLWNEYQFQQPNIKIEPIHAKKELSLYFSPVTQIQNVKSHTFF